MIDSNGIDKFYLYIRSMSSNNETHPMDLDITVQMMNDRIGFQLESIIQSNTGEDVLQKVLDDENYLQKSDTQVEIGIDVNDLYSSSATVETIKGYLDNSYSLILPNKKGNLEPGDFGYLKVENQSQYLNQLKQNNQSDLYSQNTRNRYPSNTLVGSFRTSQETRDELGVQSNEDEIQLLKSKVSTLEQNVSVLTQELESSTKVNQAIEFHHKYIAIIWKSLYGKSLESEYPNECVGQELHTILPI